MRLVYENAQRVIIWLGASNFQIDCLFDWMTALDQQVLATARPHKISTWENQWSLLLWQQQTRPSIDKLRDALGRLLKQEWFSRIWVLQEAALAKSAVITCGRGEVNSRALVVMPSVLNIDCGEGAQSRLDILPGLLRAKSWWAGGSGMDLLTLLRKFGRSKASDPRDVIYALLGLSGDAYSSEALHPNYHLSLQETIQQSVAFLMRQKHDLPKHTPIQALPKWGIDQLLKYLHDLPFHVFRWATNHEKDALLYDVLISQEKKVDIRSMQKCVSYAGRRGPAISIAIKKENFALIELILRSRNANVRTADDNGNTPLSIAVGQGNLLVARLILKYRQSYVHQKDSNGLAPLLLAANQESSDAVELFLTSPEYDKSSRDLSGDMSLLTAVRRGDLIAVQQILNHSASTIRTFDSNRDGPLNIAARRGDEKIVDLLLEKSAPNVVDTRGSNGLTPFESALVGGFSGIVKKLSVYYSTVHEVINANQFDFLQKILDMAPHLARNDLFRCRTALGLAAEAGSTRCVSLLLDRGAGINAVYSNKQTATPLWLAASRGHLDTVRLLVDRGAHVESAAKEQYINTTPLWIAALKGNFDVVTFLLKVGAKVQVTAEIQFLSYLKRKQEGTAFLGAAISVGHIEAVRNLVEGGVDINKSSRWEADLGNTELEQVNPQTWANPLWIAASIGHTGIVELLIQHGADIEARDSYYGMTPFQRAAQQKRSEVMVVLSEAGADTRLKQ